MTLDDMKSYLRVDNTDNDGDITAFITAATGYINRQTGKTQVKIGVDADDLPVYADISTDALYNLAVKLMVAHWYENRGIEIAGTLSRITHSADALINHISLCGDYI